MAKKKYNDLSDTQQKNLFYLLDKAQTHSLNKIKDKYGIKAGKNLTEFRDNVIHGLMMDEIDFSFFTTWLSHVYLEGNNTLFVYESDNEKLFNKVSPKKLITALNKKVTNIMDINCDALTEIKLVDILFIEDQNQILLSFAAPCFVVQQKLGDDETPNISKDIYLAYITIDFSLNHIVLSMHPTTNLYGMLGIRKKSDFDTLAPLFINFFRKEVLPFNFGDPDWLIDVLCDITEEYFHHNNPIIVKKLDEFKENELEAISDIFIKNEQTFQREDSVMRIKKVICELYENELITNYGTIFKETPFKVFFQEADKGVTSFKANSKGKPLSFTDSHEIVKKMLENADITSLGITYVFNNREIPYKISKAANYYSLKRVNIAATEKEIVDNVLRQLKQYKHKRQIEHTSIATEKTK